MLLNMGKKSEGKPMMEFYEEKRISASRKPHPCHVCGADIPIGASCFRECGKYNGEFFTRYTCRSCYRIRGAYLDAVREFMQEYDPWALEEFVMTDHCAARCPEHETCGNWKPLTCNKLKEYYMTKGE